MGSSYNNSQSSFSAATSFVTLKLNSLHNLKLLHCFRELAAILYYVIMLKLLQNVSWLVKPQNVILLLVSLQYYLIPRVRGHVLTLATCRLLMRQPWQDQGSFYLVTQQYYYFSIGWLYIFYKFPSNSKTHIKKMHLIGDLLLWKWQYKSIVKSSRRRENTGYVVSDLEALRLIHHNTGLRSIEDDSSATNAFTSTENQM